MNPGAANPGAANSGAANSGAETPGAAIKGAATPTGVTPPHDFTVLVVCTGNICRSPLGEQLMSAALGPGIRALSAGTGALVGQEMDETAAEMSRSRGGQPDAHRATQLTAALIAEADLVLTATRDHRAAVVSMMPRASRYTFTLAQAARLAEAVEPGDLASARDPADVIAALAAARGYAPPPGDPAVDDIDDPYRRGAEIHERVADEIDAAVTAIATLLKRAPAFDVSGSSRRELS